MVETYFDRLPVELFNEIFSYLWCHQIFQSFYSINEYISNIVIRYESYLLDISLGNIRKSEFDLICLFVNPKQIIGLKIGHNLFHMFDRYLIDINGSEFLTRLRSLWIDKTIFYNEKFSKWFHSNINFNNLISFRFDVCLFQKQFNCSFENLSRLVGCSSTQFRKFSINIPKHLTFLHMFFDSLDDLKCLISSNSNQLISLGIGIRCQVNNIQEFSSLFQFNQWTKLIQFNLNLQGLNYVQWETIETILSPMSKLKYLTLIFSQQMLIHNPLFDGEEWKLFFSTTLTYLQKFSLKLPVQEESEYEIQICLNNFRSFWWLHEKKWFIEFISQDNAFITVPDFSPKIFDNSFVKSFDMMFQPEIFYSNIEELKMNFGELNNLNEFLRTSNEDQPRFSNVKRLSLNGHVTNEVLHQIRKNIHLQRIEYFQISSAVDNHQEFLKLIVDMTHLSSLHIQYMSILRLFPLLSFPLNSIRQLILFNYERTTMKSFCSNICRLFPRLTHLTIEYYSRRILRYLLNNLLYLDQINIRLNDKDQPPNHHWIKQHTRLINHSFESEIFNINFRKKIFIIWVNYRERIFIIWINQEKNNNQSYTRNKCPIQ